MKNKSYEIIKNYIKDRGYSYNVQNVLDEYKKYINGYYVSFTMKDCIENLENEIKDLLSIEN